MPDTTAEPITLQALIRAELRIAGSPDDLSPV